MYISTYLHAIVTNKKVAMNLNKIVAGHIEQFGGKKG